MGKSALHPPVMLLMTIFSRYSAAISWAKQRAATRWGPLAAESPCWPFDNTAYYDEQMGSGLLLQMIAFDKPVSPGQLGRIKLDTNELELQYAAEQQCPEKRPLNIDPGYLTPGKFVLATTKDASHRLFLGSGIFAEVTLYYASRTWQDWPWTYPNYRQQTYKDFLTECRNLHLARRQQTAAGEESA